MNEQKEAKEEEDRIIGEVKLPLTKLGRHLFLRQSFCSGDYGGEEYHVTIPIGSPYLFVELKGEKYHIDIRDLVKQTFEVVEEFEKK